VEGGLLISTPGINGNPDIHEIRMYPTSCKHWGWDMLTSIVIHEFGHASGRVKKLTAQNLVEEEHLADKCGFENTPAELIPEQYWAHRDFCAKSYLSDESRFTETTLLLALNEHRSLVATD
jgi:hypothetical protein